MWLAVFFAVLFFRAERIFANLPVEIRDPTEPPDFHSEISLSSKTEWMISLVLDAVLISENRKLAIINNHIVTVGDAIGDKKVQSIDRYSVTLIGRQGEVVLHLFGSPIKELAQ